MPRFWFSSPKANPRGLGVSLTALLVAPSPRQQLEGDFYETYFAELKGTTSAADLAPSVAFCELSRL